MTDHDHLVRLSSIQSVIFAKLFKIPLLRKEEGEKDKYKKTRLPAEGCGKYEFNTPASVLSLRGPFSIGCDSRNERDVELAWKTSSAEVHMQG